MFKRVLLLFCFATLLFIGCSKKQESAANKKTTDATDLATTKDGNASGGVNLKYALTKGAKYTYLLSSNNYSEEKVQSDSIMKMKMSRDEVAKFNFEVLNIDTDGSIELNTTITYMKSYITNGQKSESFDSDKNANEKEKYAQFFALINNPFGVRIKPDGQILEITKTDKILNKILEVVGNRIPAEKKQEFIAGTTQQVKGQIAEMVQQIFKILPQKKIGVDTTWNMQQASKMGAFDVLSTVIYKVLSFDKYNDDKLAVYNANLSIQSAGKDKLVQNGAEYRFEKPQMNGDGKIYFNISKGCVQKAMSKISATNSFSVLPPKGRFMTRTSKSINTTVVELL